MSVPGILLRVVAVYGPGVLQIWMSDVIDVKVDVLGAGGGGAPLDGYPRVYILPLRT